MSDPFAPAAPDSGTETFVISKTENGFKVYSPTGYTRPAIVTGIPDTPSCTCADFRVNADDPDYRCAHIDAVLERYGSPKSDPEQDEYEREERDALRQEGQAPPAPPTGNGQAAQMLLKRSVSPDGRIDSLSIEFTSPLNGDPVTAIASRADEILALQDRIARGFLAGSRRRTASSVPSGAPVMTDGAQPATMLGIGGMDGRFGRRLFLRVQVGERILRVYGGKKQLAEILLAAGQPVSIQEIREGLRLDISCRVVTAPSADGRFLNVERVLPADTRGQGA